MAEQQTTVRTDQQIVNQTNALAAKLYAIRGYEAPKGHKFWLATHPHEIEAWNGACEAQLMLTHTDVGDALSALSE
jgi:hypothetical protein